ncbi:hypothetical protein K491DRAFT_715080 [Lophiostoma macrostomum CBS 122681]|uniref:Uncharacterized protein n=1 Tax=Lophiostoma macrostomum CBS 122681 TaxID=1314788 RepID=A0A6A6TAJ3_9PLEO|nr:hypothetical protein K491DRAFT_715080 [Lophiostoma macrostomum CBS 122681]
MSQFLGYLDHVRTLDLVLPDVPASQLVFRQLLERIPGNELHCVTFAPASKIRKDSLDVLLDFLLTKPTITKAVIPEVYDRGLSDETSDESNAEGNPRTRVSYRCEYERDHLQEVYYMDENNTAAFKRILEELHDEPVATDIWGYHKGRSPPPGLQNPAMTMLFTHLRHVKALRFSGIHLQQPHLRLRRFMNHVYNPEFLQELQFRDCELVEDFLEDWHRRLSGLTTLLIEDNTTRLYDPSRLIESLRNCDILENLCLQINLVQPNPGQTFLQVRGALRLLLHPFQDSLARLVLRFGAEEFHSQIIELILKSYCQKLTHFGIQEPVRQYSPM